MRSAARVLVIEDNGPNLELMTYLLNAFGYSTLTARDGQEGLAIAAREPIDIVVCDIQLPKVDGYEVARQLKSREETRSLPIVAVTAFAMVGDRDKALAAGFEGYIPKPIIPETFVAQVEAFIPAGLRASPPPQAPATTPAEPPALVSPRRSATVLVADDTETNLSLMRSLLEPFGYRLTTAQGVAQARAELAKAVPDLIVCDVHMADGTGYDLLAFVQGDPRLHQVPFVFLSSTALSKREESRALALGARRFITRPIEPGILLAAIEECLAASPEADHGHDPRR